MKTILAIDLGKFKSVACLYEIGSGKAEYFKIKTNPQEIHDLAVTHQYDCIVFEVCDITGWICDLLDTLEVKYLVANTSSEDWKGKRLKKKTDHKDALWLARRTALGDLPTVHIPNKLVREKRSLIQYRQALVVRVTQIKNTIRSLLTCQTYSLPQGKLGWSPKSMEYLKSLARPLDAVEPSELWRASLWVE